MHTSLLRKTFFITWPYSSPSNCVSLAPSFWSHHGTRNYQTNALSALYSIIHLTHYTSPLFLWQICLISWLNFCNLSARKWSSWHDLLMRGNLTSLMKFFRLYQNYKATLYLSLEPIPTSHQVFSLRHFDPLQYSCLKRNILPMINQVSLLISLCSSFSIIPIPVVILFLAYQFLTYIPHMLPPFYSTTMPLNLGFNRILSYLLDLSLYFLLFHFVQNSLDVFTLLYNSSAQNLLMHYSSLTTKVRILGSWESPQ